MKTAPLLLALCLAPPAFAAPASPAPETPTAAEVLARLKPGHPRLFITAGDWDRVRAEAKADPVSARWARNLLADADALLGEPVETYRIPDGKRLLYVSRRVLDRSYTLAFAHRWTGEARYRERLWRELEAVCKFKDWNPRHFLDTAEMTHAVAIGYDWLHDAWTPERREVLRRGIVELGLTPAAAVKGNTWWKAARHNWNQVCNGGIAIGALAVLDEAPEPAAALLAESVVSIRLPMAEYAPDGAWGEGPGYWHYATSYNVWYLAALESALGTDFGLSAAFPGFDRAALFPLHMSGPTGNTFNFADAKVSPTPRGPLFFWLARRFNQPFAAAHQEANAEPHPLDLFWRVKADPAARHALPADAHFRHTEAVSSRSAWGDPGALFVAFKAGDNRFNHSNLDVGSFILEAGGVRWIEDAGPDDYNLPGYFGDKRWTYYRLRAEGQNTLVINPGAGPDQDPAAATAVSGFTAADGNCSASADLTPAYRDHATRVIRHVRREGAAFVEIRDEVTPRGEAEIWWFAHTGAEVTLEDGGRAALLRQEGKSLRVSLADAPAGLAFTVRDAAPLPSSPNPSGQRQNTGLRKLALRVQGSAPVAWTVRFTPLP